MRNMNLVLLMAKPALPQPFRPSQSVSTSAALVWRTCPWRSWHWYWPEFWSGKRIATVDLPCSSTNGKVNRSSWIYTTQIGAYPRSLSQLSPLRFLQFVFDDRPHVQLLSSRAPLCPQRRSKKEQQRWWMQRIRAFELLTFKNVILQIYINQ